MHSESDARRIYPRLAPINAIEIGCTPNISAPSPDKCIRNRMPMVCIHACPRYPQLKLDVRPIYPRVARYPQSNSDVRPILSNVVALYAVIPPKAGLGGHGVTQGNHRCRDPISIARNGARRIRIRLHVNRPRADISHGHPNSIARNGARRGRIRALRGTTDSARGWASSHTTTNSARGWASSHTTTNPARGLASSECVPIRRVVARRRKRVPIRRVVGRRHRKYRSRNAAVASYD